MYTNSIDSKSIHERLTMHVCIICQKRLSKKKKRACSLSCSAKLKWKDYKHFNDLSFEEKRVYLKSFFDKKVVRKEGCWDWNAAKEFLGYGVMAIGRKKIHAHRVSWVIHNGEIPSNKWVLHSCDNPTCSNPEHLYLGTPKENTRDKFLRGRSNISHGEKHFNARLTAKNALKIKELLANGIHEKDIAQKFNVHVNTIRDIKMNRTWRSHGSQ